MKLSILAVALVAASGLAHADDAAVNSSAFDLLKSRFDNGRNILANDANLPAFDYRTGTTHSTFLDSLSCTTIFSAPDFGRSWPWEPIRAHSEVSAAILFGSLHFTASDHHVTMSHDSVRGYHNLGAFSNFRYRSDRYRGNYEQRFAPGSTDPLVIVQDGVSIQARIPADEAGAVVLRIHNYVTDRESEGAVVPEGYSICRPLSRIVGPL